MKKYLSILLALAIILSVASCAKNEQAAVATESKSAQAVAVTSEATQKVEANVKAKTNEWPSKTITLICPYSAGGSSDLGCRYTAQELQKILGVPVIVENVPGASGWLGFERIIKADPDRYTFGLVNASTVTGQYSDIDPKTRTENDFCYIAGQVMEPMCLIVNGKDDRFNNWEEFIAYAQKEGSIIFPSNGLAKLNPHSAFIDFMRIYYNVDAIPVNVDSSKENELMLQSGDVDCAIIATADVAASIKNGTYKLITIFANDKYALFPDAKLISEVAGVDFPLTTPRGYAYPVGVSQEIVDKMEAALKEAILSKECVANMAAMNTLTTYKTGAEFRDALVEEVQFRRRLCGDIK